MLTEYLDVYFVGFGESADLDGETIQVIFSKYNDPMLSMSGEGQRITATAKTSVVSGVAHGDAITIRETSYAIRETELVQPDGNFTRLILEEA